MPSRVKITIHSTRNTSRSNIPHPYARSATDRNLRANANSRNPSTTFTELSHPPDLGRLVNHDGKMAKSTKGMARAMANPSMPMAGPRMLPDTAASTNSVPMMGPVQENETSTRVKAMKKMLSAPDVLSAFSSILFVHLDGSTKSKPPKKAMAKTTRRAKKIRLNRALVARLFRALEPKIPVTRSPSTTYITMMALP
ncbi:hypothetical protein SDC9_149611 [bioreactor metagenome]|uniref:Uncharacterized protein n=1 Tax=bioreactor metagenome TaxID=1076179 RepID=A0A645EK36_9ZZZZ